jgi:uncharacterized membrane protein YvbJ
MYCNNCGKEIDNKAVICIHCGVSTNNQVVMTTSANDGDLGCLLGGICFMMPIVGLILYLVWNPTMPRKAKSAGKMALISTIIGVVIYIIYFAVIAAVVASEF